MGLSAKETVDAAQVINNATTTALRICLMYISPWDEKSYLIKYASEPKPSQGGDDGMFENRAIFTTTVPEAQAPTTVPEAQQSAVQFGRWTDQTEELLNV
jgi:hypothetical protein